MMAIPSGTNAVDAGSRPATGRDASPPAVEVRSLLKSFKRGDGSTVTPVADLDIDIREGDFVVILGPSGCGKTTLLRCLAGLETPDRGSIRIKDDVVFSHEKGKNVPVEFRDVSMVFQSYALWPHMTALENVAYPLRSAGKSKKVAHQAAQEALDLVGVSAVAGQYPSGMSGGQQQRVALARALVKETALVLFDEPLSNIDAKVREQLRIELLQMHQKLRFTAVYVTHDQVEAMVLADTIIVMNDGHIEQIGTPQEIYLHPVSRYVANFIGSVNEYEATISQVDDGVLTIDTTLGSVRVEWPRSGVDVAVGGRAWMLIRPESVTIERAPSTTSSAETERLRFSATIQSSAFLGSHTEHIALLDGGARVVIWTADRQVFSEGTAVQLAVDPREIVLLPADRQRGSEDADTREVPGTTRRNSR